VLAYHGLGRAGDFARSEDAERAIEPAAFARQMLLLHRAGYRTIRLEQLIRFARGEDVELPPHPLVVTFDGGLARSWTGGDAILRELGFSAAVFVDVGRVNARDPDSLTWDELSRLQSSGRWDVQLQAGTGGHLIRYGAAPEDVGPFYAYRGSEEVLGGWRERVFGDIAWAERQLAARVRGYRPLAFAPPYGNYGQAGTNDRRIPRVLLARLLDSFETVFTRDGSGFAARGAGTSAPLGRIEITPDMSDSRLHALLTQDDHQPPYASQPPSTTVALPVL